MGQIVIDIPTKVKRRYVVTDEKRAHDLLADLEVTATRVKSSSCNLTRQQLEDISDHKATLKSIEEMQRTGVSYTLNDLRHELGLP